MNWLLRHQNGDGGWGDTNKSHSNIATTMLVVAAIHLANRAADLGGPLEQAERYIDRQNGLRGLQLRYGRDRTFAVPILTNYALAGCLGWERVTPLPFELACLPQGLYRFLGMPVVSYAIPALVAIGQARFFHRRPGFVGTRLIRQLAVERSLRVLRRMQPESGGFLEAIPLTSFVVMSLASTGRAAHHVTREGLRFLRNSFREDGSWPIDTNLATWNTTLAMNALAGGGEDIASLASLDWLLACQCRSRHPYTGAAPGGWGWSDLSGAVPDADDTPGALLALDAWRRAPSCRDEDRERIESAAAAGAGWLLGLQNSDGGWPTFCRGWGKLPFDRSGADLTAHALRGLRAWRCRRLRGSKRARRRGWQYLQRTQRSDGSWVPLWFGNQDNPAEENPVYGTARVLLACRDCERTGTLIFQRGCQWLASVQRADGGWGGLPTAKSAAEGRGTSSVEETALAVEALLAAGDERQLQNSLCQGLKWLVKAVMEDRHWENSPIGFYFAKLWYHEKLYPVTFAVAALGQAVRRFGTRSVRSSIAHLRNA
jgi:squalene-hopene/tetraprenyl-beta-curcumene cyclase